MKLKPGMKVAEHVLTAPDTLALGKVTEDGEHVVWYDLVDAEGRTATAFGGMRFGKTPRPLSGRVLPCPEEFADLIWPMGFATPFVRVSSAFGPTGNPRGRIEGIVMLPSRTTSPSSALDLQGVARGIAGRSRP